MSSKKTAGTVAAVDPQALEAEAVCAIEGAGTTEELDHMTRGRTMFGVGPGSLVYDAVKMGLKAEDQRRKLDESLDVIMELMQGRMVTRKTDWFDLQEARLQLRSYSQPMMEMAVASSRSPVVTSRM